MTTETRVIDYSDARPSPATIKADGLAGVIRYIAGGSSSKHLTAAEAKALHAAGLSIGVVFESTANRARAGHAAGVADATAAARAADALGVPKDVPIFFAVDFDDTTAGAADVKAYFAGIASYIPQRAGVYGERDVINAVAASIPWRWETAAWSGGVLSSSAHLLQRATPRGKIPAGTDENVICKPIPFWGPSGAVTLAPPAAPATSTKAPTKSTSKPAKNPGRDPQIKAAIHDLDTERGQSKRGGNQKRASILAGLIRTIQKTFTGKAKK